MPVIFRIECAACGQTPALKRPLAGWVTTDGCKGGLVLPEGYLALKLDTEEFVCLPHPIENRTLEKHGFTWSKAGKQGRLFRVTYKVCTGCGLIHEERQIQNQQLGCNIGLLGAVVAIVFFKLVMKFNWGLSFLLSYVISFAIFGLAGLLNKVRWRGINRAFKLKTCPSCCGIKFVTISQAAGKTLPCPLCGAQNVKYTKAGIS